MTANIYLTDEGYGPIVRQSAICEELIRLNDINFSIYTKTHLNKAKDVFKNATFHSRFNNVIWNKTENGKPDTNAINAFYSDYDARFYEYVKQYSFQDNADFLISDFVYEAFKIAELKKIPVFGVAHFTWEWFFNSLEKPFLHQNIIDLMYNAGKTATKIYLPPFTPKQVLKLYQNNKVDVPLIVRRRLNQNLKLENNKFKILIIDSGAGVLKKRMLSIISQIPKIDFAHFYMSNAFQIEAENVTFINSNQLFVDLIPEVDLVVGRAGFNTISECIAYRTPMLLLSEGFNPEMESNIELVSNENLGAFVDIELLENNFYQTLSEFINKKHYDVIKKTLSTHNYSINGAAVIAEDILNTVNGY